MKTRISQSQPMGQKNWSHASPYLRVTVETHEGKLVVDSRRMTLQKLEAIVAAEIRNARIEILREG